MPEDSKQSENSHARNNAQLKTEFERVIRLLDSAGGMTEPKRRKRPRKRITVDEYISKREEAKQEGVAVSIEPPQQVTRSRDPVNRLARTLRRYKQKRLQSEDDLYKIMEKVKIDKSILIKEKLTSIWQSTNKSDVKEIQHVIGQCKHKRQETNVKQRDAYQKLLIFLRDRRPG